MRKALYGILPSLFWDSDEGRAIQARGKDPLILSTYLRSNPHATMIGFYRVRLDDVFHELPVLESIDAVRAAFAALQDVGFAFYDYASACVWVRDMARERLNLPPGKRLDPEDGRKAVVQRLYDGLPPNPFLDRFYEVYGHALRLTRRTFAQPSLDIQISTGGAGEAPGEGAGEGALVAGTSTAVPDPPDQTDQIDQYVPRSDRTAAPSAPRLPLPPVVVRRHDDLSRDPNGTNYQVIERAAWELMRDPDLASKYYEHRIESLEDLVEATKRFCGRNKIDYGRHEAVPFTVVTRACGSVWTKALLGIRGRQVGPS